MRDKINQLKNSSNDRVTFCVELINKFELSTVAEVGVFRGDFAEKVLRKCEAIERYTMIDPWRNLSDWNKPSNKKNSTFEEFFQETMQKTEFVKEKRKVLRGKTTEIIGQIEDNTYDFVYIDGDHTLRGISIDLINLWPKVKSTGFIVGDDFSPSIWQHSREFEPTMVFPFAVYFAEALNVKIYALPYNQFLIAKGDTGFEFIDLTHGKYNDLDLRAQLLNAPGSGFKQFIKKRMPFVKRIYSAIKK